VIFCLAVLFAVEERENLRAAAKAAKGNKAQPVEANRRFFRLGIVCALAVLVYQVVLTYFWYSRSLVATNCAGGPFFGELFVPWDWKEDATSASCSRYYGLISILLYALVAFLAVTVLIPKPRSAPRRRTEPPAPPKLAPVTPAPRQGVAAVLVLTALLLGLTSTHALGSGGSAPPDQMAPEKTVVVGFRTDAPPFSYLRQFGRDKRYAGYLAQLCDQIFSGDANRTYRVIATDVTALDRFERLVKHANEHLTEGPDNKAKVDLLCDPVTLRYSAEANERAGARRTDGIFSPIVYVTGVSYLARSAGGSDAFLGFVGGTTARRVAVEACSRDGLRIRDNSGGFDPYAVTDECESAGRRAEENASLALAGFFECQRANLDYTKANYNLCSFGSHTELVDWFCADKISNKRYYFGDRDLIIGQVEAWQEAGHVCDGVTSDYAFRSYEPYALLISKVNPDLVQFVQRRIYEIFSDREQILGLFAGNFKGKAMSTPLASLFNLNGVEDRLELAPETLGSEND
jgi:hypothetical protein